MSRRFLSIYLFTLACSVGQALAVAPAAPTEGSVQFTRTSVSDVPGTNQTFHLSWKDNAVDEEGFEIQWRPGDMGTFNTLLRLGPNADSGRKVEAMVATTLLNVGTAVQFRIIAWKLNKSTVESSFLSVPYSIPGSGGKIDLTSPSNMTAIVASTSDGLINLSWADNSDEEDFFWLQIKESTATTWSNIGFVPFGTTNLNLSNQTELPLNQIGPGIVPVTLIPGKTYNVTARAVRGTGATSPAIPASFVVPTLRAPTNLTGTVIGESTVRLNWTDNSSNETGYEVQFRPVTSGTPPNFEKFGSSDLAADSTSVNLNIGQSTALEFRIAAVYRSPPSGATSGTVIFSDFTPGGPSYPTLNTPTFNRPTGLTATTSGMANTVDLTWQDNTETEYGFDILCRPSNSPNTVAYTFCRAVRENVTKVSVDSFTTTNDSQGVPIFTPLTVGTSYDFIVKAVGNGESIFSLDSQAASATPQLGFTSRMYQPITQDVNFNHTVTTSAAASNISATGLPPPLSIDTGTGVISGAPTQSGTFPVTLTATFSSGPLAVATLMLRVEPKATAPTRGAIIPNVTIGINQPYTISLADKFTDTDSETAVRWETTKGNIDFLLYPSLAPLAVANFMNYVNGGDYTDVFFHRHMTNFVLQAGGFAVGDNSVVTVEGRSSPLNEPGISNLPWTIAAAKVGARTSIATLTNNDKVERNEDFGYVGNPNSATTDIFINLNDNSSNLDNQNGGFTVYGRVSEASRSTVNGIRALPVGNYGGALTSLPVDAPGTVAPNSPTFSQLVKINRALQIPTLNYSIDNVSPDIATVVLENNQLKLTGLVEGTRIVTVTATDLDNKPFSQNFTITVSGSYQTPTITTQPASVIIAAQSNTTLSVNATGTGITYQWRKNNTPLSDGNGISGVTTKDLLITAADMNDEGDYDVIVANTFTTLTSNKARLSLRSPAAITGSLPSVLVEVGKPLVIQATVTGTPTPTCVWRRGTTVIAGQTTSKLTIPLAKLSDAGLYTVTASNTPRVNTVGGGTASVIVIDKNPRLLVVKPGSTVRLIAPVSGPNLTYIWKKGTTDIEANRPRFAGRGEAVLTITAADLVTDSDDYTCTVNATSLSTPAVTGVIKLAVAEKPELLTMLGNSAPTAAFAGIFYEFQIPHNEVVSKTPTSYRVTGLPKGLTLNTITGLISGVPTEVGNFILSATATNPSGSSSTQRGTLRVLPMLRGSTGTFVARVEASTILNQNHGGKLSLTISDASTYSASLQMGAEIFRTAGNLTYVGTDRITQNPVYRSVISIPRKNRPSLNLLIDIISGSGSLSGFVGDGTNSATLSGYRLFWNLRHNPGPVTPVTQVVNQPPVASFNYQLNVALDPDLARTETPQGSGYVALTVNNNGLATITGRLADDTLVTSSTPISGSAQMYFFQMLNKNTSSLSGLMNLVTQSVSNAAATAPAPANLIATWPERTTGEMRWFKGVQPSSDKRYQAGFSPTTLRALGNTYNAPGAKQTIWGIPAVSNNLNISFSRGGLSNNFGLLASLTDTNSVTLPLNNPTNVTLKIIPSTGSYTGSFELNDLGIKRKTTFNGLIIPAMPDSSINELFYNAPRGAGFFLLPGLTTGSPIQSGKAELTTPLNVAISNPPPTRSVTRGSSTTLTATATASSGLDPVSYQWRKNNQSLSNDTRISGVNTANLTLTNITDNDAGSYTCIAYSGVFQAVSSATVITVTAP